MFAKTCRTLSLLAAVTALSTLMVGSAVVASASAASASTTAADPTLAINWTVNASTHLKKLNLDVTVPQGKFVGSIDLLTGNLTGDLTLPPAQTTISVLGLPAVTATFVISEAGPITGHVNLQTLQVTSTASFNIRISRATLLGLPINLVGSSCRTSQPVTVTMAGKASLSGSSTFSSTYTIPPLQTCGLATPVLNLLVPGPGNTFTATFAPA
jgi:hypothetical protein